MMKVKEKVKDVAVKKNSPCDRHRILVADDDDQIRDMFELVLSCDLPECRVDVAVNGAEVVDAFRSVPYELIVLDVRMPKMGGEETFQKIRDICEKGDIEMPSFVFCTGYEPPHALVNVVAENRKHCLLKKPVDLDTLVDALRNRMGPNP